MAPLKHSASSKSKIDELLSYQREQNMNGYGGGFKSELGKVATYVQSKYHVLGEGKDEIEF